MPILKTNPINDTQANTKQANTRINSARQLLKKANLYNEKYKAILLRTSVPASIYIGLHSLEQVNLLTKENADFVLTHKEIENIVSLLNTLVQADLLTEANFSLLRVQTELNNLDLALSILKRGDLLTQEVFDEVFDSVIMQNDLCGLSSALCLLKKVNLLTKENVDCMLTHKDINNIEPLLDILDQASLLTSNNFNAVIKKHSKDKHLIYLQLCFETNEEVNDDSNNFYVALNQLHEANLLTQTNLDVLINEKDPLKFSSELCKFHPNSNKDQKTFSHLFFPSPESESEDKYLKKREDDLTESTLSKSFKY